MQKNEQKTGPFKGFP